MKNNNSTVIKKLIRHSLLSNKKRNFFIVTAIILTTFMITSVFSVGMSIFESFKMQQIRLEGSKSQAAFSQPTNEQLARINTLDYLESSGTGNYVAAIQNTPRMVDIDLNMAYFDESLLNEFHVPAWTHIVGKYPQKADEIMASRWVLENFGITNPKIGMTVPISFVIDEKTVYDAVFTLSGYYTNYDNVRSGKAGLVLVSKELSDRYGKSIRNDGSVNIIFKDSRHIGDYVERLKSDLELTENQKVITSPVFDISFSEQLSTFLYLSLTVLFLILTGYLLIYNVLYISVSRDVRFYGLLKALGTTPKQIRRIVIGQVMRLCIVGIPGGALLAAVISFAIIPVVVSGSNVETGTVISFSPFIYIGAAFFALITALVGAVIPAKKAARISPIEAVKYTGESVKKKHVYSSANGKPYKMALRNIFRDRKRAIIVLLSLFLGVTTFMTVTVLVSSMDINKYASSSIESDFLLQNKALETRADRNPSFTVDMLKQIENLPGIEEIQITTHEWGEIQYTPEAFEPYLNWYLKHNEYNTMTKEQLKNNFTGIIHGIDKAALVELNKTLSQPIDIDAFARGDFALISSDEPGLFNKVGDIEVMCYPNEKKFVLPFGGFVPQTFKQADHNMAPTIFVPNTFLRQYVHDPLVYSVNINVLDGYDEQVLVVLKEMLGNNTNISMISRVEARQGMQDAKKILFILGGGIAIILGLIGVLNFVNIMSVGILVRKREFATLESIGMSRKQMRRILLDEGLGYAVITLLLVATAGNALVFGIYKLFSQQADYVTFTYPSIPMLITTLIILIICIATSEIAYRSINRTTIVERLREAE